MNKNTKLILVVAVVGTGAYFLMKRNKNKISDSEMLGTPSPGTGLSEWGDSINIEASKNKDWIGIPNSERIKATAMLSVGQSGSINGNTPCSISEFWIDKNGKKGAFRCDGADLYEISDGSTFMYS